jgi:hypothetical protein
MSQHSPIDVCYQAFLISESPDDFLRGLLVSSVHAVLSRKKNSDHADSESMKKWVLDQSISVATGAAEGFSRLKQTVPSTFEVQRLGKVWVATIQQVAGSDKGKAYLSNLFVRFPLCFAHPGVCPLFEQVAVVRTSLEHLMRTIENTTVRVSGWCTQSAIPPSQKLASVREQVGAVVGTCPLRKCVHAWMRRSHGPLFGFHTRFEAVIQGAEALSSVIDQLAVSIRCEQYLRAAYVQAAKKREEFRDEFDDFFNTYSKGAWGLSKANKTERLGLLYAGAFHGISVPDDVMVKFDEAKMDLIEGVTGKKRKASVEGSPVKKQKPDNDTAGGRGKKRERRDVALVDASFRRVKVCDDFASL